MTGKRGMMDVNDTLKLKVNPPSKALFEGLPQKGSKKKKKGKKKGKSKKK
jgi:hypothetical protein